MSERTELILCFAVFFVLLSAVLVTALLSTPPMQIQSVSRAQLVLVPERHGQPESSAQESSSPPSPQAQDTAASPSAPADEAIDPVNINLADAAELETLPGIGPTLSARIIDYRENHGAFTSVNQLLNVTGIGERKLEKLLPYATVG